MLVLIFFCLLQLVLYLLIFCASSSIVAGSHLFVMFWSISNDSFLSVKSLLVDTSNLLSLLADNTSLSISPSLLFLLSIPSCIPHGFCIFFTYTTFLTYNNLLILCNFICLFYNFIIY